MEIKEIIEKLECMPITLTADEAEYRDESEWTEQDEAGANAYQRLPVLDRIQRAGENRYQMFDKNVPFGNLTLLEMASVVYEMMMVDAIDNFPLPPGGIPEGRA